MSKIPGVPSLVRQERQETALRNRDFKEGSVIIWLTVRLWDLDLVHVRVGKGHSLQIYKFPLQRPSKWPSSLCSSII